MAKSTFRLSLLAVAALGLGGLVACGGGDASTKSSADASAADSTPAPTPSGKPLADYRLVHAVPSKTGWVYVILKNRPTEQELKDLAIDFRAQYPSTSFEFIDSASNVNKIEAFYDGDTSVPETFLDEHDFATLNNFNRADDKPGMQWALVATDSHYIVSFPNSPADIARNQQTIARGIARLESNLAEQSRCKNLQGKSIGALSSQDLARISDCKTEGFW